MTLARLREALAALPAHLSGWTLTTVESVLWDGVGVVVDCGQDELEGLRQELKDVEKAADAHEKELEEANERADKAETEVETLRNELHELKDPIDGTSVADYRERASQANSLAEQWRGYCDDSRRQQEQMSKELAAMRKRKGVEPGLMAHSWEVSGFLNEVLHYGAKAAAVSDTTLGRLSDQAKLLKEKIQKTATL